MRTAIAIVILLFAASLAAQPLTVGTQIVDQGGTATITSGGPVTYVNLSSRATANGAVARRSTPLRHLPSWPPVGHSMPSTDATQCLSLRPSM